MNQLPDRPSPAEFAAWIDADIAASTDPRPPIVVFDRDGTLASVDWVRPWEDEDGKTHGWDRFNTAMPFDAVVPYTADLLRSVPCGVGRFMFSGRAQGDRKGEDFRFWQMLAWLAKNDLPIDKLLMRSAGDQRRDSIIKQEFLDLVSTQFRVVVAVDDRDQVCDEVWRANDVPLVQVVDPSVDPMLFGADRVHSMV